MIRCLGTDEERVPFDPYAWIDTSVPPKVTDNDLWKIPAAAVFVIFVKLVAVILLLLDIKGQ
jgi:hypothetical protein